MIKKRENLAKERRSLKSILIISMTKRRRGLLRFQKLEISTGRWMPSSRVHLTPTRIS